MHIFINYKRRVDPDHDLARRLEEVLKSAGHTVFRDESSIHGGTRWAEVIEKGIREAHVVLSLVSNAALSSDWVLNEIDFALRHGKVLLPIVLEKLEESLEFQEFIPRFLRIQYLLYSGDAERLSIEVLHGLDEGAEGLAGRQARHRVLVLDELDDSANPAWQEFAAEHVACVDGARVRLGLDQAVRLAMLRSTYYRRSFEMGDESETHSAVKSDSRALEAYRQCMSSRVTTGVFGATGFARSELQPQRMGISSEQELSGFLGLMIRLSNIRRVRHTLTTLEELRRIQQIRFEVGMLTLQSVEGVKTRIFELQNELAGVEDAWEEALEQFQTYVLGLPANLQFEPDDVLLNAIELTPPWAAEMSTRLRSFRDLAVAEHASPTAVIARLRSEVGQLIDELDTHIREIQATWERRPTSAHNQLPTRATTTGIVPAGEEAFPPPPSVEEQLQQLRLAAQSLANVIHSEPLALGVPDPTPYYEPPRSDEPSRDFEPGRSMFGAPRDWDPFAAESVLPPAAESHQPPTMLVTKIDELDELVGNAVSLFSRVRLAGLYAARVDLTLDRAEQIAAERRADADLLQTNAVLRRRVRDSLRRSLTEINRRARDTDNWRQAADSTLVSYEGARLMFYYGQGRGLIDDVLKHSIDLFAARHRLQREWLRYQAARLQLHRDLGLLEVDNHGCSREVDLGLFR